VYQRPHTARELRACGDVAAGASQGQGDEEPVAGNDGEACLAAG